jgi:hypothetical protein
VQDEIACVCPKLAIKTSALIKAPAAAITNTTAPVAGHRLRRRFRAGECHADVRGHPTGDASDAAAKRWPEDRDSRAKPKTP